MQVPRAVDAVLSRPRRWLLALAAGLAYLITFEPLRPILGPDVSILSVVPVIVTAGLLGFWPGVLAGALLIPVNSLWLAAPGEALWEAALRYYVGHVAGLLVGGVVGLLSDVSRRFRVQSQALAHEIAERRQAEAALRDMQATLEERVRQRTADLQESEARYRQIYESNRVVQLLIDPQTLQIVDGNAAAAGFYGYDRAALARLSIAEINCLPAAEIRSRMAAAVAQAHTTHTFCHRLAGGEVREVEVHASPITVDGRRLMHALVHDITEQRRYATILQRYRLLSEHARDIILFVRAADGRLLEANAAAIAAYGYTEAELLGLSIHTLRGQATQAQIPEQMQQASAAGVLFETEHRRKDGSAFPVEVSSRGLDLDGERVLLSIVRDITQRKRAERALAESERRFRETLELSPLYAVTLDTAGRIMFSNDRLAEAAGQPAEALVGQDWFERFIPPEIGLRPIFDDCVRQGAFPANYENEVALPSAGRRLVIWTNTMLRDAAGRLTGIASLGLDVTEPRRLEQALCESEAQLRLFYELPFIGMAITSPKTKRWVRVNERLAEILGYPREVLVEKTWAELTHPDDLDADVAEFERVLSGASDGYRMDKRFIRPDGAVVHATIDVRCVRAADGSVDFFVATVQDIGDRKRIEAELERRVAERTAQLEVANRELEAFAYSVSHDLRAPLRAIDGFSQALVEDYDAGLDTTGQDYLRRVRQAAQQMGQLIDALLLLSRVTRQELRRQPVDLSALAQQVAQDLAARAPGRPPAVHIQPGLAAAGDPRLLGVVLTNLLGNAWKFTRRQAAPQIEFGLASLEGERAYFVRDNGAGFDPAYAAKLFQPFQRLHGAAEFEGTGIGLATVQRIIQRHGGRVWAESRPEAGATFYFTLPD